MTMTSVAVAPGSLGAPPAMLTPTKSRYHLQPSLEQNSSSPSPIKNYDTLSKGKKSWSVRLGLSRQSHQGVDNSSGGGKGWGTISGGSALSRQMLYGDPWLYGTVRSSRGYLNPPPQPPPPPPPGAPILVVCSCPEFLSGTTRKLGNCRKCGGHRLAGVPLGGTCRMATASSRSRPSLAGMLRMTSVDDPYDVMRRSRLVEPRSRARSISPHRATNQRDSRSQSVARTNKDRIKVGSTEVAVSRTEWFDNEPRLPLVEEHEHEARRTIGGRVIRVVNKKGRKWHQQETNAPIGRQDNNARRNKPDDQDWKDVQTLNNNNNSSNKNNNEDNDDDDDDDDGENGNGDSDNRNNNGNDNGSNANEKQAAVVPPCVVSDSRKSILECDVNPYLLVKKQTLDEDDLSDDLSDNALELDEEKVSCSSRSLFDPSKVKSIERLASGISAVAAIGGQRIRVFNEPREISDEEAAEPEAQSVSTRIPIPKISPKRPPRRAKEARTTLKSILKRGKADGKRKNVLFNVNNVIFAPEKAPVAVVPSAIIIAANNPRSNARVPGTSSSAALPKDQAQQHHSFVAPPVHHKPDHQPERPKFITIPNIRDPPNRTRRLQEARAAVPQVKIIADNDRTKVEESVIAKRPRVPVRNNSSRSEESSLVKKNTAINEDGARSNEATVRGNVVDEKNHSVGENENSLPDSIRAEDETEFEIEIEELAATRVSPSSIGNEDEQLILKSGDDNNAGRRGCLSRSQSDRTSIRPETSAASVNYLDTMRLSLRRRARDENDNKSEAIPEVAVEEEEKKQERDLCWSRSAEESTKKENEGASLLRLGEGTRRMDEHFRRMRPTSWSPPPGKLKHRDRASHNAGGTSLEASLRRGQEDHDSSSECRLENWRDIGSSRKNPRWRNSCLLESCPRIVEVTATNSRPERNVCKITVSPRASPLIHRLRINGNEAATSGGARGTSIMINGDQNSISESRNNNNNNNNGTSSDNKVTISVGGEDSVCNPTVISVNSSDAPKIQTSPENRTLVILDNYRSNIVLESTTTTGSRGEQDFRLGDPRKREDSAVVASQFSIPETTERKREKNGSGEDERGGMNGNIEPNGGWSNLSKESVISKLLEDSLRKARENGEILDVSSGEAILRILKQSLLKSKDYESSESTIEPEASYSRSPSLNSDTEFVSTNLFLEENPYEVIKEPIYEEIPDEPPPLPLSPPPPAATTADDYIKDTVYFAQRYKEAYYKKVNAGQFLRSYLSSDDVFKNDDDDAASTATATANNLDDSEEFTKNIPTNGNDPNITSKFKLLNFLVDSKDGSVAIEDEDETEEEEDEEEEEEEEEEEDEDEDEEEEDTEGDLEALYEQKETSMGDLSSKSSQISNVSDSSSEDCNIIITSSSSETIKSRTVDIERTDSGVGSESSQASSGRGISSRRWRTGNVSSGASSLLSEIPQVVSGDGKLCEDCEQRLEPLITDSGVVYAPFVCRKCSKKRAERKEIITEIVETEQKYGRDLQIILEEFHRPMLRAGLLTQEQLAAIFLNVEELHEHNLVLAEKLKEAVEFSQVSGDEDLVTVDVGKIFLESERMLHAFESYCTRQGGASLLLQNLEKEKELLRIFLKVSQMENTVLRRMNLNSFLMVPVQRVTKYPLLLARLLKATPAVRIDVHEARKRLEQARANIELHLEHMNAEAKDVTSTKLWRRISIIQNGRRSNGEHDMVNIKLRKMAVEILDWAHEEARFVLEGRLLVAQPTDNNWRRGRTVKLAPVTAMLVTNGKPRTEFLDSNADLLFPRQIGVKEATLLLVKEKIGRYSLLREPLFLDKCIVCCETDLEDYFEIQELSSKETFIFKAEDGARTKRWCRTLQAHAQSLGAWRRRRGALPNIMICGVARS